MIEFATDSPRKFIALLGGPSLRWKRDDVGHQAGGLARRLRARSVWARIRCDRCAEAGASSARVLILPSAGKVVLNQEPWSAAEGASRRHDPGLVAYDDDIAKLAGPPGGRSLRRLQGWPRHDSSGASGGDPGRASFPIEHGSRGLDVLLARSDMETSGPISTQLMACGS